MENPEIEKLKERVQKDPASTLFVPLAELYRKEGQLEDAIEVLKDGIRRQPGYTSARVSLGKIYFEKSMMHEAEEEFKGVVSEVPDNLFAHKKLAEIYTDRGDIERAVSHYKTVTSLNPMDEEAHAFLENSKEELKKREAETAVEEPEEIQPIEEERPFFNDTQETEPIIADDPFAGMDEAAGQAGGEAMAATEAEEVSLAGMEEVPFPSVDEVAPMPEIEEEEAVSVEAEAVSVEEEAPQEGVEEVSFAGVEEEVEVVAEEQAEEVIAAEVEEEAGPSEVSFDGFVDEGVAVKGEGEHAETFGAVEVDGLVESAPGDGEPEDEEAVVIDGFIDEDMEEVEVVGDEDETPKILSQDEVDNLLGQTTGLDEVEVEAGGWPAEAEEEADEEEAYVVDLEEEAPAAFDPMEADAAIAIGDYKKALDIYSAELERNPDNSELIQRADELKGLMKLLGMGSDKVVKKLEGFLENIKARKDEFHGSA